MAAPQSGTGVLLWQGHDASTRYLLCMERLTAAPMQPHDDEATKINTPQCNHHWSLFIPGGPFSILSSAIYLSVVCFIRHMCIIRIFVITLGMFRVVLVTGWVIVICCESSCILNMILYPQIIDMLLEICITVNDELDRLYPRVWRFIANIVRGEKSIGNLR